MEDGHDALLDQTLRWLQPHIHSEWDDREPMDVFNRLLAKNIRPDGWTPNTHLNIEPRRYARDGSYGGLNDSHSCSPATLV